MTSAAIIKEIEALPPDDQAQVIQYAFQLAETRQLTADELGELAEKLSKSEDPAEILRLKSAMRRGFYGE